VHYEALDVYKQHSPRILGVTQIPNLVYTIAITTASQAALQAIIAHHGTVFNNPDPIPTSINLSSQQLIVATANILPTINVPTFADLMGEFFRIFELKFPVKSSEKFYSSSSSLGKRMKPLKCYTGGSSNSKKIPSASQTWKLPTDIFVRWKVLQHSMRRFCNEFL